MNIYLINLVTVVLFCFSTQAQQTLYPKSGIIWVSWEEAGHIWMAGCRKNYATANDDPGFLQTPFDKAYAIKIQGDSDTGEGTLFNNCCTTNIIILTNYTGTITVGTNMFKVNDLLKRK